MNRGICCCSLWVCMEVKSAGRNNSFQLPADTLPPFARPGLTKTSLSPSAMRRQGSVQQSPLKRSRRKDWLRCKRGSSAHEAFPAGVPVGRLPANPAAAAAFPGPPETLGEFPLQLFSGGICVSHQPWMPQGMVPKNQQLGSFSTWTQEIYSGLSVPSASHRCSSGRRGEEKGTWGHQNWTESVL